MNEEGLQQSAILLMSIGEREAAEVFKFLSPREVQRIGESMARLKGVSREQIDTVMARFDTETGAQTSLGLDSSAYLRAVLGQALGEEKANLILDRILEADDNAGIERLRWIDAATVTELIKSEHPQIIATILVHLEHEQVSEILSQLTPRLRNDVLLRIATLDGVQPNALRDLNDVLGRIVAGGEQIEKKTLGGARKVAEILNMMAGSVESEAIESIKEHDAELAQHIQDEMFRFEDLSALDDRSVQALLRELQGDALVVALKGADSTLREKILRNMSQRAGDQLREDLESRGPVRLSEVEAQQKEILKIVRRLVEEGQIALVGKGDDSFV